MRALDVLVRHYLPREGFDASVRFYEELLGQKARLRFSYAEMQLELVQIANLLLIGGDDEALAPFRATQATIMVDDLDAYAAFLGERGAETIRPIRVVPTGRNLTVRNPDGFVVEFVEHRRDLAGDSSLRAGD